MKKQFLLFFFIFSFVICTSQNCDTSNINGQQFLIPCGQNCLTLNFQISDIKTTTDYIINSIPYTPFPYIVNGGSEDTKLYDDDYYSSIVTLPFPACFYGDAYTSAVVGSNGLITFDISNQNCSNAYTIDAPIPYGGFSQCNQNTTYYPKAAIMAAYSDLDPRASESPADRKIQWRVEGNAPYRKFIISYYHVGTYNTNCAIRPQNANTFQIIFHESTGIIDIFFENKSCFSNTNAGKAILGVQDFTRLKAVAAVDKNATIWTAKNEGYRFTPNGGLSQFISCKLYAIDGTFLSDANVSNITPGFLNINFPNVCPATNGINKYIVKTLYNSCTNTGTICNADTITINKSTLLSATITPSNTTCGLPNGNVVVDVNPLNGVPPFKYSFDGGTLQNNNIFTGLPAGLHSFFVTDAIGCNNIFNVDIATSNALSCTATFTNTSCAAQNTGTITVTATRSTAPPISYSLDGNLPQLSNIFTNVNAGLHNISITDLIGCTSNISINVGIDEPFKLNSIVTNLTCYQNASGKIIFHPSISYSPYLFSINGGNTYQTDSNFIGLSAGTYLCRVKNANNCYIDTSVTLTEPPTPLSITTNVTNASCQNNDGEIAINVIGNSLNNLFSINNGLTYNTNNKFTGLSVGNYNNIIVKDANGCTTNATAIIGLNNTMFLNIGNDTTICQGKTITFSPATNNAVDSYNWTPKQNLNVDTIKNPIASPLDTTHYTLTAQWGICQMYDDIIVNVLHKPKAFAGKDTTICFNSTATLNGSASNFSGTISYNWTPTNNVTNPNSFTTLVKPNNTQQYRLTVTDNYGCNFTDFDDVLITMRLPVNAFAGNDSIAIINTPHQLLGSGGKYYLWSPPSLLNSPFIQNPVATIINDTHFTLLVTDDIGCTNTDTVFIKVYKGPTYYIPNAFTPNGDGKNDVFIPIPVGIKSTEYFIIFNRFGEKVFETTKWMQGWDGTFKGKKLTSGNYIWAIKGIDKDDKIIEMKGSVLLLQ